MVSGFLESDRFYEGGAHNEHVTPMLNFSVVAFRNPPSDENISGDQRAGLHVLASVRDARKRLANYNDRVRPDLHSRRGRLNKPLVLGTTSQASSGVNDGVVNPKGGVPIA